MVAKNKNVNKPNKQGRMSILTPELQDAICEALKLGTTLKAAAEYVGTSYRTMRTWITIGRTTSECREKCKIDKKLAMYEYDVEEDEEEKEKLREILDYKCTHENINVGKRKCKYVHDRYVYFFHAQLKARGFLEVTHLKRIDEASKEHWAASAWTLERIIPEKYPKVSRIVNETKDERISNIAVEIGTKKDVSQNNNPEA